MRALRGTSWGKRDGGVKGIEEEMGERWEMVELAKAVRSLSPLSLADGKGWERVKGSGGIRR